MKTKEQLLEECRLHAESQMDEGWNRKDEIFVGIFYKHFTDHLYEKLDLQTKQQAIAFAMWLQRTNPTGLISTLYVKFIEHQNQKPTNE